MPETEPVDADIPDVPARASGRDIVASAEATRHDRGTEFVLIPGAWMGAWIWEPVSDGLRALGHGVHPVTLSGLMDESEDVSDVGLETHVDDVLTILETEPSSGTVLVGHSYSGLVAGQVADRAPDRVAHTVLIDGFTPRDGQSLLDAFPERQREDERAQIADNRGRWPAPSAAGIARQQDLSTEQARWLAERLVDHPGRTVSEPAVMRRPLARQRGTYVGCSSDAPADITATDGESNWTVRRLDAGHWSMLSAPDELVSLLDDVASNAADATARSV